ncbi:lipid A hydroxylase LpxO [Pseudomonas gingeri]|uniref:Lipid A hydroxylase LpxO n=1 Tax=Pseudomonas gingeri TaxID=117681 RepID=A0A7Y8CI74_9PSED|nr:lipid A hydroxylase LpxO [Pseudomonas gingeri]NWC31656.1 lipid A hydroxylase LpxO [Pseudomonas gingeri]NWD46805.1 lipid A hydroxylase LpxO [Pseudomonas gingeri]
MKLIIIAVYVLSIAYVHLRGQVRHKLGRQLSDHSSFLAPINCFLYLFSKIPSRPYLQTTDFPELKPLQDNWQEIREEALALLRAGEIKKSERPDDVGFNSFFKSGWKRFYLKWYGDNHPSALELCPRTTELLNGIGTVKAAMFAELPPGSKLVRHRDPYAGSLRYHLGLETPNDAGCYINVDGQNYHWRDGEPVMFDETFIHYAENTTDKDRVILFCDIERPMKYRWAAAFNRWFSRNVMAAAAAPNGDGDKTGGINKAFARLYVIRQRGKALKKTNRTRYYLEKWAIFAGLLALFLLI